jgi:hypothetical protein
MHVTPPESSPEQPQHYAPPTPPPGYGSPYAQQPWPYQGPPAVVGEAGSETPKRSRRGLIIVVVGLVLAAVVGGVLTVVVGPPSLVKQYTPIGKDSGVAACEALRDKTIVSHAQAGESQADGWARARKLFADSRYGDLRDSGTKLVDLMAQYDGLSSDGNSLGAGLFMGSQIIQAYGTLSGSCSAHGVNIPALGTY